MVYVEEGENTSHVTLHVTLQVLRRHTREDRFIRLTDATGYF